MVALSLNIFRDPQTRRPHERARPRTHYSGLVSYLSENRIIMPKHGDISLDGAFISTCHPDPIGTSASVQLEYQNENVVLEAEVTRVSLLAGENGRGAGMGVRFKNMTRQQKKTLIRFMVSCKDYRGEMV